MAGRQPYRRKGSGAQSRPEGSADTFSLIGEAEAEPEHQPSVEGADAPLVEREPESEPPKSDPDWEPGPDPDPVPNARKYVVRGPKGERFMTYNRDEAREFQQFGCLLRKRK